MFISLFQKRGEIDLRSDQAQDERNGQKYERQNKRQNGI